MNYKLIILLFMLTSCIDLEIIGSDQNYGDYVIDANVQVKSNENFLPIESALVKMDWRVCSYFDYVEQEDGSFENECAGWDISDSDSGYTDSNGDVNLSSSMNLTYLSNDNNPEISFYVSCSGFQSDTSTFYPEQFNASMWDSTYNVYRQNIDYTIHLIPEN